MSMDSQPIDPQTALNSAGVMDNANNYLNIHKQAKERENSQAEYDKQLEERNRRKKVYDGQIERFSLENPTFQFKHAIVGDQALVDDWAEQIKNGDLTKYTATLWNSGSFGALLPDELLPNRKMKNPQTLSMTDQQKLEWEIEQERKFVTNANRESIATARQMFHMQNEDEYPDTDVAATLFRHGQIEQAKLVNGTLKVLDDVFGEQSSTYLHHAVESLKPKAGSGSDPFIIGDDVLRKKWRDAMDGENGILNKHLILDQNDPSIPMQVGGNKNALTFMTVHTA